MYFYHEGYHEAYYADAPLEDWRPRDRRHDDYAYDPISWPSILNWLLMVSVALCGIVAAIDALS
jgi:hypothetical protein